MSAAFWWFPRMSTSQHNVLKCLISGSISEQTRNSEQTCTRPLPSIPNLWLCGGFKPTGVQAAPRNVQQWKFAIGYNLCWNRGWQRTGIYETVYADCKCERCRFIWQYTLVIGIFEGNDTSTNLAIALDGIAQLLEALDWSEWGEGQDSKVIELIGCGDYDFYPKSQGFLVQAHIHVSNAK